MRWSIAKAYFFVPAELAKICIWGVKSIWFGHWLIFGSINQVPSCRLFPPDPRAEHLQRVCFILTWIFPGRDYICERWTISGDVSSSLKSRMSKGFDFLHSSMCSNILPRFEPHRFFTLIFVTKMSEFFIHVCRYTVLFCFLRLVVFFVLFFWNPRLLCFASTEDTIFFGVIHSILYS